MALQKVSDYAPDVIINYYPKSYRGASGWYLTTVDDPENPKSPLDIFGDNDKLKAFVSAEASCLVWRKKRHIIKLPDKSLIRVTGSRLEILKYYINSWGHLVEFMDLSWIDTNYPYYSIKENKFTKYKG